MSILNVSDRERELEGQISKLNKDLAFVERWASHHGAKTCHSAESILGVIQHYPPIKAITNGYVDGVVPDTYDPYAEIAELRAKLAELETRCKWPSCQTPEFQDGLANEVASELFGDVPCSDHPDAPHGFNRNASHNAGRFVCDCEGWTP